MKYKLILLVSIIGILSIAATNSIPKLEIQSSQRIKVIEPSDIILDPKTNGYFVVSDDGYLVKLNQDFSLNKKFDWKGYDCEAITLTDDKILVMNESARQVTEFDLEGNYLRDFSVLYMGARNSGFESLIYDKSNKKFISITEKNPVKIFEFDEKFNKISETYWENARDISSATLHNGKYYFLSDEDRTIFEVTPGTYKILRKWKINILNPEGITFDKDDNILIVSDDLEKVYNLGKITDSNIN